MAFKMRMKKGVNIPRVVTKIFATVIALYVGGTVINALGQAMNCTESPFYSGLQLIGYTVSNAVNASQPTGYTCGQFGATLHYNVLSSNGSGTAGSVLTVIGIIGIGAVILEFVQFSW